MAAADTATADTAAAPAPDRTAWARNLETPLREFLRTETGSSAVLLAATVAALVWVNVDGSSYSSVWHSTLSVRIGRSGITQDVRAWVNSGLMTIFFFVVGLEARREFDMGELRERRRVTLPLAAGIGGMVVPIAIFLAVNAGHSSTHGWGVAMSTDTAFVLGMLALVGPHFPGRLRAYVLTVAVVDDIAALLVIAIAYSGHVALRALAVAAAILALIVVARTARVQAGIVYAALGLAGWVALSKSGVDAVVIGLAMGLLTYASPAARTDLERATDLFRLFREQPTPELARSARAGVSSALSPNLQLQQIFHPWSSYAIVPLFALANAGIAVDGGFLAKAYASPVTLGIVAGYVLGKPAGIVGSSWLVTKLSRGRLRPPVGWAAVTGAGAIAGIGFTVSLLIATLAFGGVELEEAKLGVLTAALAASTLSWLVFRATALLPTRSRMRAMFGTSEVIVDLAAPVDDRRDHIRGRADALVTLVEYGDFECPFCGRAEPVIGALLADFGELRYVWRHLPLNDVHTHAQLAAEAAEAAALQGAFWEMYDRLLGSQGELDLRDLIRHAEALSLDLERFRDDLRTHAGAARIAEDVDSADLSGVSGTPTFFVNGRRHNGAYDIEALTAAVRAAKARALIEAG